MRNKQRQAITDWIAQNKGELAITLTFLPNITEARARKTLRRWWNEVDRKFYGNAVKRPAKRVKRVCVLETGKSGTNYHFHISTNRPKDRNISLADFRKMLELRWERLSSAGFVNDFQPIYNNYGWADYITKEITATNTDALDLSTTNIVAIDV
jgi:hypothetical protein